MLKKDPIFWWASAIFALALGIFAATQNQLWLALMIASYLLRPTLASLGVAKRYVDERQMSIHYRSGNIGFAVMVIVCVIFAVKLSAEDSHDFELFFMAIVIGLAAKALSNVLLGRNYLEAGSKIIIAAGLLVGLFASLDAGSFAEILVCALGGGAIAGVGLLGKKYPKPVAVVALIVAALLVLLVMTVGLRNSKVLWSQIVVALVIGGPLITAGVCLLVGDRSRDAIAEGSAA